MSSLYSYKLLCSILIIFSINHSFANGAKNFPKNFKFGVATSAYQIEGAWNTSDKSESIWDHLTHNRPDIIAEKHNGDIACDSYHLYKRDVEMLKELGVDFYRFSISWTRLLPTGFTNHVSQDGLNYYNNLINVLIENKIEPVVTLYHWDLPQRLQNMGGWTNPLMVQYFEDYARFVFRTFGDRVKVWITFNEPKIFCVLGYGLELLAPAMNLTGIAEYQCAKNVLLSHATVYHMYKKEFGKQQQGKLSMTFSIDWYEHNPDDFDEFERDIQFQLGMMTHPVYSKEGGFPNLLENIIRNNSESQHFSRSRLPQLSPEEKSFIKGTYDFFGLNFYTTYKTEKVYQEDTLQNLAEDYSRQLITDKNSTKSASYWLRTTPRGLKDLLNYIREEYDNPEVMILENGFSDHGDLEDTDRIEYLHGNLKTMLEAIDDGCNVTRYAYWSLMDNFQWLAGYTEGFGLYSVDFTNSKRIRTPKASAFYYKNIIRTKMLPDDLKIDRK